MIPECPRTRCHCGQAAAVPNQNQNQNRSVLLSEISTPIRTEPFTDRYDIIPGKELGRGKFAVVRKCVEKCSGREYAAKFLRKRRKGQDCRTEIIHEIAVLEMAKSSAWVVNLHQVYEMTSEMVLVLEFAAGGEIFNQCVGEAEEAFSEEEVKKLMRQILEGVAFLHRNNVVHLDLKPQNILLTSSDPVGDIKIVDFGLSRRVSKHQELREIMGTPEYVAPEILNYDPISTATDMWSIGVLAYVMLTGVSPFLGEDKQETFLNISTVNVSYADEELQRLDSNALRFIQSLLLRQPQERATAEQCLLHAWLQPKDQTSKTTEAELTERPPSAEPPQRPPGSQTPAREEEEEPVTEELIVMATYALGQCRHTEQEGIMEGSDQKALVSKRFKFQEPFGALHDVIY